MSEPIEPKRERRVAVAVRLPANLVRLLDEAALADAQAGWSPSRSRVLARVLPDALRPLVEKVKAEEARA